MAITDKNAIDLVCMLIILYTASISFFEPAASAWQVIHASGEVIVTIPPDLY